MQIALLDLEGVIVDTAAIRRDALARSLADADVEPGAPGSNPLVSFADAVADAFAATRDESPSRAATLDATAAELATLRAERYFAERLGQGVTLAPGAREAVAALGLRARLGVVTGLRRRDAALLLERSGLDAAFGVVVTADDVRRPRPAPDGHLRALERLARLGAERPLPQATDARARPLRAVALESTRAGIVAARLAGMRVVGVGDHMAIGTAAEVPVELWVPGIVGVTYDSLNTQLLLASEHDR